MAVIACEHCGKEKAVDAKTCVHCGGRDKRVSSSIGKLFKYAFIGFLGLVALSAIMSKTGDPKAGYDSIRDVRLERVCKDAVEKKLRAPATAQWGNSELRVDKNDSSLFYVMGAVDAQNGFGALLRNDYVCKVTDDGAGNSSVQQAEVGAK